MNNKEILQKAIEKAVEGGWEQEHDMSCQFRTNSHNPEFDQTCDCYAEDEEFEIIFSHSFAKAFWGEAELGIIPEDQYGEKMDDIWKHHLCMMVLEEDPIKYLESWLK